MTRGKKKYYFSKQHQPADVCNADLLFSLRYGLILKPIRALHFSNHLGHKHSVKWFGHI